eukprot:8672976-Pyramimonas_sp.AAC.1
MRRDPHRGDRGRGSAEPARFTIHRGFESAARTQHRNTWCCDHGSAPHEQFGGNRGPVSVDQACIGRGTWMHVA